MEEKPEIDINEITEKYEDKSFFRRIYEMLHGLREPRGSREYKIARTELQRMAAPLISLVSVSLFVIILIVTTAIQSQVHEKIEVDIAPIEEETPPVEEQEPDETPPDPEPIEDLEITVDTPTPNLTPSELTPVKTPMKTEQVSVKPAEMDTVSIVKSPVRIPSIAGSRNPGAIGRATSGGAQCGDATTEACVLKVLWWLKKNQATDGSWKGPNTLANTALATLTYLAHGEWPGSPSPYKRDFGPVVQMALDYLYGCVNQNGDHVTMTGADGNEYAFLIATYALCEAYAMTKNPNCRDAAYVCLDRIVRGQSRTGGWDYKINPNSNRDDMSFAGWALQVLKAGKMAGIHPEGLDECIKKAIHCLKTRNFHNDGFTYIGGSRNPTGLTATGCLAMQLLGYGDEKEVRAALGYMKDWTPAFNANGLCAKSQGLAPQYYCYYATQCKYQAGMKPGAAKDDEMNWVKWNAAMKKLYPASIIDDPEPVLDINGKEHKQGHFENMDAHTSRPVMDTCLAALQLMVYYRYLPTTQATAGNDSVEQRNVINTQNDVDVKVDL